jgi:CubicO group peptidase (beta-lactamase class C family)
VEALAEEIDAVRDPDFSGVVSVRRGDTVEFERAYGLADRETSRKARTDTRFGLASVTKGFTAVTVASLVAEGSLTLDTPARSLLGADLPLIADDVTVRHLLGHTSGIGDYVDEEIDPGEHGYVLKVPFDALVTTEDYLPALDGFPTKFRAGQRFAYCNSGYVVLALIAERVAARAFVDLVADRVFAPAGMTRSAFLQMDELPPDAAAGYLPDGRPNRDHLPRRGSGDGGAFSTVADLHAFWTALFAGRLLPATVLAGLTDNRANPGYGLGFWLEGPRVALQGGDMGVSTWTVHDPASGVTYSVLSNTETGVGKVKRRLDELLTG